jgi:hypothetical protein
MVGIGGKRLKRSGVGGMFFAGALGVTGLVLLAAPYFADSVSLVGSLDPNTPSDVLLFAFALSGSTTRTIQTYGYGGGTNAAGQIIPAGGFDPYVSLFVGTGPAATFLASKDGGLCPPANFAPACHDSTLVMSSLAGGSYTLALSVFDNFSSAENFGSGTNGQMTVTAYLVDCTAVGAGALIVR